MKTGSGRMKGKELRQTFLAYFESKGHARVPSSSLVPQDDPTLLFSNAGMNQFKDYFIDTDRAPWKTAASAQKCLRISGKHNDLENVGVSPRHHTFFEMLENFSFGAYFKTEAIQYAWEFLTETLKLPKKNLWVTVFEEDEEAKELWGKLTDVSKDRILKMGAKDCFWTMGDTGPCGPSSEIHYYIGPDDQPQSEEEFRKDDGTYVEIWNLVFMQSNLAADGSMTPLSSPCIDTGMGFERVVSILQGKSATYDADILRPIISVCEKLSGVTYDGSSYEEKNLKEDKAYASDVAMRVIADHSRSIAFMLADGVHPGSDGRGYVLRRLIRRAIRHGKVLNFKKPFLSETVKEVIAIYSETYNELKEREDLILKIADAEERKFQETLDAGLSLLEKEIKDLKPGTHLAGKTAFALHDTYGFPLDLTQDALKAYNLSVDVAGFEEAMKEQKSRSREDRKTQNISYAGLNLDSTEKTDFLGYNELETESKILHLAAEKEKKILKKDDTVSLIFNATPFYAESGGQVGDTGVIELNGTKLQVFDTQKAKGGQFIHSCKVLEGELSKDCMGSTAVLKVDAERRQKIKANHSATHLVHAALRTIIGPHVKQAGSRVDDNSLRFDYSHFEPVEDAALKEIQHFVNQYIRSNYAVSTEVMSLDAAKKKGAMALFGEKYGDTVRVVSIGPDSIELCGGTHVERSGDIGFLTVSYDSGISAGVRRIECRAAEGAEHELQSLKEQQNQIAGLLKSDSSDLADRVEKLLQRIKTLEKEVESQRAKLATAASGDLLSSAVTTPRGIKIIAQSIENTDTNTLRDMVDRLKIKLGSGVVALGSIDNGHAIIVAGVTEDLTPGTHAGNLIKEAVKLGGGKGGGRADFAQAGGLEASQLRSTLDKLIELVS